MEEQNTGSYAIVAASGSQFKVVPGQTITVNRVNASEGETYELADVLYTSEGNTFGAPLVDGAKVVSTVISHSRGKKLVVFKKRRRKNSKTKRGHRQELTTLKIESIECR